MGKISYLDKKEQANKLFNASFYGLKRIITALEIVGNENLANSIRFELEDIENARELYEQGFHELFNEMCGSTQQASENMFKAALAVAMNMPMREEENG